MSEATSYDPSALAGGVDAEILRLGVQAALSWPQEAALLERAGIRESATILDVGCGSGAYTRLVADLTSPAARVIGIDCNRELLMHARSVHGAQSGQSAVEYVEGDGRNLPFERASIDFVIVRFVLQHVADPVQVLREARRVLRPGGTIVTVEFDAGMWGVSEPQMPALRAIYAKAEGRQIDAGGNRFLGRRLHRLLRAADFEQARLESFVYHSDEVGLEALAAQMHPDRLLGALETSTITPAEFATAAVAYSEFCAMPNALVVFLGFVGVGRAGEAQAGKKVSPEARP